VPAFAVAGRPVLHSRSPQIFNAAFRALGYPGRYVRLTADTAAETMALAGRLGLAGLNVTTPFKETILSRVDAIDEAARALGAVNTIVRRGAVLRGADTDPQGVLGALAGRGVEISGRRCLVAGAGGAGRAACWALAHAGGRVTVLDLVADRSARAAHELGVAAAPAGDWEALFDKSDIVVSAAPGGSLSLGGASGGRGQVVLEADYRKPGLKEETEARGLTYIPGRAWLEHQARPALGLFLDRPAEEPFPEIDWRDCLEGPAAAARPLIALIGFMGAGKSAVGRALAAKLGWAFADSDEWIEKREGRSVAQIFDVRGEAYFRGLEKEALIRLGGEKRLVLSCGGGAVLDPGPREILAASALTVWLDVALETALGRLDGVDRPLLRGPDRAARAERLLAGRREAYLAAADLVLANDGEPARAVGRILEEIRSAV
jgi:shikimate dehydrogenase